MIKRIMEVVEPNGFEVVSRISEFFGMRVTRLRLLFIYLSFFTIGAFFVLYLVAAFFLWVKDAFVLKRPSVFDL